MPPEAQARQDAREAFRLAAREHLAICPICGFKEDVARFYRCRWCGLYFCVRCSVEHFQPEALKAPDQL
jgi:hypothetical protein